MSYDVEICVKAEGSGGVFVAIGEAERAHPTYNLGPMLRACMGWDYRQSEKNAAGDWVTCYYPARDVLEYAGRGIEALTTRRGEFVKYNPPNGYGTIDGAREFLEGLRGSIREWSEVVPLECLYVKW